jgi:diguanylate cyclase (GGDEF)-like protein/putative nucleotidyltransferase with HDIG domain
MPGCGRDELEARSAMMEGQLSNSREDVVVGASPARPGRQDGGFALHAGATVGVRLAVVHLAAGLAFLFIIAATFAVQFALQTPAGYAAQGLLLLGLALVASGLVYLDRRVLTQLAQRLAADLSKREAELEEIANRDDLTQLRNRRFFYARLQEELQTSAKTKRPMTILMLDIDALKAINDEFGHHLGDVALVELAKLMTTWARPRDTVARLGGDEFAIIMPNTDHRGASALAGRLWQELENNPIHRTPDADIYLGVSIGVSGFPRNGDDPQALVHWADADLYANKLARKGIAKGFFGRDGSQFASGVVGVLCAALDIRDKLTHRHSQRVATMAVAMGRRLGLSKAYLTQLAHAAVLHDIGKIGVADSVLSKPAGLDENEWKEIRRHPELGYELLRGFDFLKEAAEIVVAHHERYDGAGYPRGLVGDEIPFAARIFAVIDAFDAMTSRRPYREPLSQDQALEELVRNAGSQFDHGVVKAFVEAVGDDVRQREDDSLATGGRVDAASGRRRWSSAVDDSLGGGRQRHLQAEPVGPRAGRG